MAEPTKLKMQLFILGITQAEIARRANVSISYINRVINGEQKPSKRIEEIITDVSGIPADILFGTHDSAS